MEEKQLRKEGAFSAQAGNNSKINKTVQMII